MLFFFITFFLSALSWADSGKNISVAEYFPFYYRTYLNNKISDLSRINSSNGFIFFTDSHIRSNDLNTSKLINFVLENTLLDKVVWGGDAISAYGSKDDMDYQWAVQKKMFSFLKSNAKIYCIRGNHDFTIKKSSESSDGFTYSQKESFKMISDVMNAVVVRNDADSASMYYYFDDNQNKIRYVVLEAFSNFNDGNVSRAISSKIEKKQLKWIAEFAIKNSPSGFNIVFLLHAPITDTTGGVSEIYRNVLDLVSAASEKRFCIIDNEVFDFSTLENVNVLMVVSGHHHHDMQTYQHGVLHVTTASDAHYNDYMRDPFSAKNVRRKGVAQHCVDVFFIDLKSQLVRTIRLGVGGNRLFHLKPVEVGVNEHKVFQISLKGNVKWYSYNASGNYYKKGKWILYNDVVSVSNKGSVIGLSVGEAVLMAQDDLGNREIFNVNVK